MLTGRSIFHCFFSLRISPFRWVQAGKGADERVMEEIMLGEPEYHSLYAASDEQEAMRQSESNKEDMRALKTYQTRLTIYNSVQKRVALLRGLEDRGLLAHSKRPPPPNTVPAPVHSLQ